ncbi:hypothetical protein C7M84_007268 [Penaeus vannamei]|uniref:Retropepsins domain-containing protein n=1 Tax=Penaeus vannamei TaxID=6689 RepID=A0A423TCM6_PENVA|nr:hypothetical protein C7M84_007268 [Penaeus vannamei]
MVELPAQLAALQQGAGTTTSTQTESMISVVSAMGSTGRPLVELSVNGRTTLCFIDTGSEATLVKSSAAILMDTSHRPRSRSSSKILRGVTGQPLHVTSELTLPFHLDDDLTVSHQVAEADISFPGDILIGMDLLRRLDFALSHCATTNKAVLVLEGRSFAVVYTDHQSLGVCPVTSTDILPTTQKVASVGIYFFTILLINFTLILLYSNPDSFSFRFLTRSRSFSPRSLAHSLSHSRLVLSLILSSFSHSLSFSRSFSPRSLDHSRLVLSSLSFSRSFSLIFSPFSRSFSSFSRSFSPRSRSFSPRLAHSRLVSRSLAHSSRSSLAHSLLVLSLILSSFSRSSSRSLAHSLSFSRSFSLVLSSLLALAHSLLVLSLILSSFSRSFSPRSLAHSLLVLSLILSSFYCGRTLEKEKQHPK